MEHFDVVVVGGGPAGSTCAWKLRQAGLDVIVLDAERFPRTKLCAGWITPQVVDDLELDIASYPCSLMTFPHIYLHWKKLRYKHACTQHSIRRFEFDHYLLTRAAVRVDCHTVKKIELHDDGYALDDRYHCRYLVGAAGTRCPVYRRFFRAAAPRDRALQTVTYEHEIACDWSIGDCHLWFFDHGLPGYSWYVPKAQGYLNLGIGGLAGQLKNRGDDIKRHWQQFTTDLNRTGLIGDLELNPNGYSYYLRGSVETVRTGNALIIGDAVGLATIDMCEGIGPAVKSGLLAADSIVNGTAYSLGEISRYSGQGMVSRLLGRQFAG